MINISERQQWFRDRIGKRVYRNSNGCDCQLCDYVLKNGVLPEDKLQADYLYDTESDYNSDKVPLRYFDTKEEAEEFSKTISK